MGSGSRRLPPRGERPQLTSRSPHGCELAAREVCVRQREQEWGRAMREQPCAGGGAGRVVRSAAQQAQADVRQHCAEHSRVAFDVQSVAACGAVARWRGDAEPNDASCRHPPSRLSSRSCGSCGCDGDRIACMRKKLVPRGQRHWNLGASFSPWCCVELLQILSHHLPTAYRGITSLGNAGAATSGPGSGKAGLGKLRCVLARGTHPPSSFWWFSR